MNDLSDDTKNDNIPESSPLQHGKEEWFDKHGKPTYSYLTSLVEDGNPRALETLMGIADQYNVEYSSDSEPQIIVDQIVLAMKEE